MEMQRLLIQPLGVAVRSPSRRRDVPHRQELVDTVSEISNILETASNFQNILAAGIPYIQKVLEATFSRLKPRQDYVPKLLGDLGALCKRKYNQIEAPPVLESLGRGIQAGADDTPNLFCC